MRAVPGGSWGGWGPHLAPPPLGGGWRAPGGGASRPSPVPRVGVAKCCPRGAPSPAPLGLPFQSHQSESNSRVMPCRIVIHVGVVRSQVVSGGSSTTDTSLSDALWSGCSSSCHMCMLRRSRMPGCVRRYDEAVCLCLCVLTIYIYIYEAAATLGL